MFFVMLFFGQDLQIIKSCIASQLIASRPNVTHQTFRSEIGTLFLIGEQGHIVVRQCEAEEALKFPLSTTKTEN